MKKKSTPQAAGLKAHQGNSGPGIGSALDPWRANETNICDVLRHCLLKTKCLGLLMSLQS
jgi:hypothetical protein